MDKHVETTLALLAQHTSDKPSADAILIACQISALTDAMHQVATQLGFIDAGIDEANSHSERRLNRGI